MKHTTDVAIIGGGIIGCAVAYYLRKHAIDALVLERGAIGSQASGAAAGLLAPLGPLSAPGPLAELLISGLDILLTLLPELEETAQMQVRYEQTGALRVVRNPKRVAHLRKRYEAWQTLGFSPCWLSGDEARQRVPMLSPDVLAAVYAPEEGHISAPALVQAYARAAQRLGAHLYTEQDVCHISIQQERVTGLQTAQGLEISCRHLVLAAGAWSTICGQWLHAPLAVQPLQGQMLALKQPEQSVQQIIFGEGAYIIPKGETVFVGATKEQAGLQPQVTAEGVAWLRASACKLLPSLADSPMVRAWAGIRPRTPDLRPLLGPLPGWENVFVATGHNSVGVMLSAITGKVIADFILNREQPQLMQSFLPARFAQ
ncbi:glycine oxidase [Thermosporothrix hazakensis]|jgi:glycine oxidase|uniref:glycine oxidase n=1 Tax=Thermosporothrix hazakensis TaxID=644383 RepID=A0A326U059_THEHA|nr:glycine oxidase ThiO [Thermosporothrix hazakensis]PZW23542.1 glycine oxidase [Thermosporothrix hazakensis]GCE51091.1 glycine oxidase ThiO [Thermosporothrix hazakensis]